MKKAILFAAIVFSFVITIVFVSRCSYKTGVIEGRADYMKHNPCLLCDRSIKEFHAFDVLDVEPDSAIYCHDCHKVHLFFPGMEYKDEAPKMQRLQVTSEYVKFSAK